MLFLKQSTASQTVLIGPFVDSTDGVTAEGSLTIANTDIRLSKNGANIAAKNSGGGTHDENGWYQITLDATDTDTVGKLQLHCVMSGALPVWHEYYVLEENIYEALFASGAAAFNSSDQVAVGSIAASAITATSIASNAITATKIASDAITAAKIAADAIGASELASDAASEIATAVWAAVTRTLTANTNLNDPTASAIADAVLDEPLSGHVTAGTLGKAVADIETDATAILADTNELQTDDVPTLIAALPTAAENRAEMDSNSTQLAAIVADTNELQTDDVPGLIAALNDPTASAIADAVLDEDLSGHVTAGTLGKAVADIETDATAILADTNELQTDDIPGTLSSMDTKLDTIDNFLDTEIAAILEDTGTTIPALIAALNDLSAADVNAQVLDVLNTDTFAEPTGVPGATVTLAAKIGFLYMAMRNKKTVTSSKLTFYDDDGNAEWEKDLSDDSTTYTESEGNAI